MVAMATRVCVAAVVRCSLAAALLTIRSMPAWTIASVAVLVVVFVVGVPVARCFFSAATAEFGLSRLFRVFLASSSLGFHFSMLALAADSASSAAANTVVMGNFLGIVIFVVFVVVSIEILLPLRFAGRCCTTFWYCGQRTSTYRCLGLIPNEVLVN